MLRYCMVILTKVSFDKYLFAKELSKAFLWLSKKERTILRKWCVKKFGKRKKNMIVSCYPNIQKIPGKKLEKQIILNENLVT